MTERIAPSTEATEAMGQEPDPLEALMLHFFTNLALAQEADATLARNNMGRIHHRVLAIATASPGITVGQLLKVLRVTHQNVRLPIKQLVDKRYVLVRADRTDRRQRRLYVSASGRQLLVKLQSDQFARVRAAFAAAGPEAVEGFMQVHRALVDPTDLDFIQDAMSETDSGKLAETTAI